jgi:hypothetical protein
MEILSRLSVLMRVIGVGALSGLDTDIRHVPLKGFAPRAVARELAYSNANTEESENRQERN